jgi:hypothetical protein
MIMIKQILQTDAYAYFKDQLVGGGDFSFFLSSLDLTTGDVFTVLPNDVIFEEPINFENSYEFRTGVRIYHQADSIILNLMYNYLQTNLENCIIFESYKKTSDLVVKSSNLPYFSVEERVYYFAQKRDSKETILECLYKTTSYPKIVVFARIPDMDSQIQSHEEINRDFAQRIAATTECIMAGAFDDEGYVFWVPNDSRIIKNIIHD